MMAILSRIFSHKQTGIKSFLRDLAEDERGLSESIFSLLVWSTIILPVMGWLPGLLKLAADLCAQASWHLAYPIW